MQATSVLFAPCLFSIIFNDRDKEKLSKNGRYILNIHQILNKIFITHFQNKIEQRALNIDAASEQLMELEMQQINYTPDEILNHIVAGNTAKLLTAFTSQPHLVNTVNKINIPILHLCIRENHSDIIQILFNNNVDIYSRDRSGKNILHIAVEKGYSHLVESILNLDTENRFIDQVDSQNRTPFDLLEQIHTKIAPETYQQISYLLRRSPPSMTPLYSVANIDPFHLICENKNEEFLDFINANKNRIHEFKSLLGRTLLHQAVVFNNEYAVQLLINNGFALVTLDRSGNTALHLAAKHAKYEMVRILMQSDAFSSCLKMLNDYSISPLQMLMNDRTLPEDIAQSICYFDQKKVEVKKNHVI